MHVGKLGLRWGMLLTMFCVLLGVLGCSAQGYRGGLGGVLPEDFRQGEVRARVRGDLCRTAEDGYTPPSLNPMDGMGVSMKDTPMSFEAEITAAAPVDESGMRDFSLTYTSPEALRGVTVACRVSATPDGVWQEAYALSLAGEYPLSFAVDPAQVAGLLFPLYGLLPVGDVTDAIRSAKQTRVVVKDTEGRETTLIFDTAADSDYPISVEWQDSHGWLKMRVTEG